MVNHQYHHHHLGEDFWNFFQASNNQIQVSEYMSGWERILLVYFRVGVHGTYLVATVGSRWMRTYIICIYIYGCRPKGPCLACSIR